MAHGREGQGSLASVQPLNSQTLPPFCSVPCSEQIPTSSVSNISKSSGSWVLSVTIPPPLSWLLSMASMSCFLSVHVLPSIQSIWCLPVIASSLDVRTNVVQKDRMKAVLRLLSDMETLALNALQECKIVKQSDPDNPILLMQCLTAVGALTTISGAVHGARLAIMSLE